MTVMVLVTVALLVVVVTGVTTVVVVLVVLVVIVIMVVSVATNFLLFDLEALLGAHQASSQVHQEERLVLIQRFRDNNDNFLLLRFRVTT